MPNFISSKGLASFHSARKVEVIYFIKLPELLAFLFSLLLLVLFVCMFVFLGLGYSAAQTALDVLTLLL